MSPDRRALEGSRFNLSGENAENVDSRKIFLAQSRCPGSALASERECPLLGVKRTSGFQGVMSAFDPKRHDRPFKQLLLADTIARSEP
jgi:hypothetical protein